MDKRRFFSKFYFVLLTCLLILPCSKDVSGADWILYATDATGLLSFYDADSINFLSNNISRVWIKIIPASEEDRVRYIQDMRNIDPTIPDNWGSMIALYEINCKNKTSTPIQSIGYSITDELIKSHTLKHLSHIHITPETMSEALYNSVCVKQDLKKERR